MSFSGPIQCYHSQADPIWPDGTFNICKKVPSCMIVISDGMKSRDGIPFLTRHILLY